MLPLKKILAATDFSDASEGALEAAIELARRLGAHLTLVHVYETPPYPMGPTGLVPIEGWGYVHEAAQNCLRDLLARVQDRLPRATAVLREGSPAREIVSAAGELGADLIVMGTHGRRGVAHAILGSVAERVVRTSPIPVLTLSGEHPAVDPRLSAPSLPTELGASG